jgi:hypothetical protein
LAHIFGLRWQAQRDAALLATLGSPISSPAISQLDISLRSQPDHERSFASAAHSDTSNREIGNT